MQDLTTNLETELGPVHVWVQHGPPAAVVLVKCGAELIGERSLELPPALESRGHTFGVFQHFHYLAPAAKYGGAQTFETLEELARYELKQPRTWRAYTVRTIRRGDGGEPTAKQLETVLGAIRVALEAWTQTDEGRAMLEQAAANDRAAGAKERRALAAELKTCARELETEARALDAGGFSLFLEARVGNGSSDSLKRVFTKTGRPVAPVVEPAPVYRAQKYRNSTYREWNVQR